MPFHTPADPHTRPNAEGPDSPRAADHNAVVEWLAHVEAGRIGSHLRPTASHHETRNPPTSDEHRERILANERVMRGDRPSPIW